MINFDALKTSLNILRQEPDFQQLDSLTQKTDEATQQAFLELARNNPSAFGNPEAPIKSFADGVRRFIVVANEYDLVLKDIKAWENRRTSLKEIIEKIDFFAAKMSFWMLRAITHKESTQAGERVNGKSFTEGYPIFLSELKDNDALNRKVVLQKEEPMKITLIGEGNFAFPAGLERVSPNLNAIHLPQMWIKVLSCTIGQFAHLRDLNLRDNLIKNVPSEIGQLKELRFLDLSENCIERLPESISGCSALEELNVAENPLETLPKGLMVLGRLNKLDLRKTMCDLSESKVYATLSSRVKIKIGERASAGGAGLPIGIPDPLGLLAALRGREGVREQRREAAGAMPNLQNLVEQLRRGLKREEEGVENVD